jgi:hypothetical protein
MFPSEQEHDPELTPATAAKAMLGKQRKGRENPER